jgi:hypothetical protein
MYAHNPKLVHDVRKTMGPSPRPTGPDAFAITERIRVGGRLPTSAWTPG